MSNEHSRDANNRWFQRKDVEQKKPAEKIFLSIIKSYNWYDEERRIFFKNSDLKKKGL